MESPPRERPSASRADRADGFLSFGSAPCDQLSGQLMPGAGGMLVRADHGGIGADRPLWSLGPIAPYPQPVQDLPPGPVQGPAAMPVISGLPVPVLTRQITPAGTGPEQDPVDHHPVIGPPPAPPRIGGHHRQQPLPFLTGQVMPVQAIIHPP